MIGQRLRDLREDADMTQEDLGKVVMLGKHSISAFERDINEPKDEIKIRIARHFNVSVDFLLGLTDDAKPHWGDAGQYVRLPADCPAEIRKEAEEYIRYLAQKHRGNSG